MTSIRSGYANKCGECQTEADDLRRRNRRGATAPAGTGTRCCHLSALGEHVLRERQRDRGADRRSLSAGHGGRTGRARHQSPDRLEAAPCPALAARATDKKEMGKHQDGDCRRGAAARRNGRAARALLESWQEAARRATQEGTGGRVSEIRLLRPVQVE